MRADRSEAPVGGFGALLLEVWEEEEGEGTEVERGTKKVVVGEERV